MRQRLDLAPGDALILYTDGTDGVTAALNEEGEVIAVSLGGSAGETIAPRLLGVLQTTWCGMGAFVKAYRGEEPVDPEIREVVACFQTLFAEIRRAELR